MRILAIADETSPRLWGDHCREVLSSVDLILSAGDLPARYLSFLTCFTNAPVVYVCGNHDDRYDQEPPEGCMSAEGKILQVKGVRILGLGGSIRYRPDGKHMYSEKEMAARISSLRRQLRAAGGFDILLTHSPIRGLGDQDDLAHRGLSALVPCWTPGAPRSWSTAMCIRPIPAGFPPGTGYWHGIPVINASTAYEFDLPETPGPPKGPFPPRGLGS